MTVREGWNAGEVEKYRAGRYDGMMKEETSPEIITTPEKDYIAVYDKKMLRRANLYIDEGAGDWNNVHPWNAPAEGDKITGTWADSNSKSYLAHWNATDWGYNEWNKVYDFNSVTGGFDITSLKPGNGTQNVIQIPSTRWYYGMWRESNPTGLIERENLKTTAYDYQGWDTPFSYAAKIDNQKELMSQWYSTNKLKYGKPKYQWKKTGATINEKKESLGENFTKGKTDAEIEKIYDEELKSKGYEGELNSIDKYHDMIFSSDYNANNVPFNKSGLKLETEGVTLNIPNTDTEAVLIDERNYYPYIPGLSDSIAYTDHPDESISYRVAGTDCIGLVQRSINYEGSYYSALTEAMRRGPVGWENTTRPSSSINNLHNTSYAVMIGDKTPTFKLRKNVIKNGVVNVETVMCFDFFKYLVPGDIVYYPGQHIMIVNSISEPKYTEEGEAYWEDGSGVTILENVYFGSKDIVGVSKKRNLSELTSENSSKWAIWRQK